MSHPDRVTFWRRNMKVHRSHDGMILGVCRGLEESIGLPAKYTRILLVLSALLFRAWFILALYLAAALFMPLSGKDGWNIQRNFEDLGQDARKKAEDEYREMMESLKKIRKTGGSEESGKNPADS